MSKEKRGVVVVVVVVDVVVLVLVVDFTSSTARVRGTCWMREGDIDNA